MNDILYEMARLYSSWKDITYRIVLGRKQKTYELMLHFPATSFFHIAGLQHLTDLDFGTKSKSFIFKKILNKEITTLDLQKSVFYEEWNIANRVSNLGLIPDIIELGKAKYLINRNEYRRYTRIEADYLMEYDIEQRIFYLFSLIVQNNPDFVNECVCCSFFQKERVDFTKGTMSTKVLLIEKIMYMGKENEMRQTVYKNPVYVR